MAANFDNIQPFYYEEFTEELLQDPEVRKEYERLQPKYDLIRRRMERRVGIPKGCYCYDNKGHTCVYWSRRDDLPYQESGYCWLIGKSDWDINEEIGIVIGTRGDGTPSPPISAHDFNMSLLWDKVKECGYD